MYASARQFMGKNTVLFVSHDMASVKKYLQLCNSSQKNIKFTDPPKEVTEKYFKDMYKFL